MRFWIFDEMNFFLTVSSDDDSFRYFNGMGVSSAECALHTCRFNVGFGIIKNLFSVTMAINLFHWVIWPCDKIGLCVLQLHPSLKFVCQYGANLKVLHLFWQAPSTAQRDRPRVDMCDSWAHYLIIFRMGKKSFVKYGFGVNDSRLDGDLSTAQQL